MVTCIYIRVAIVTVWFHGRPLTKKRNRGLPNRDGYTHLGPTGTRCWPRTMRSRTAVPPPLAVLLVLVLECHPIDCKC